LEYEVPKWDGDLASPNAFVPLSLTTSREKVEKILSAFPSQAGKPWFSRDTFMAMMRLRGNECRGTEGHAEAFFARKLALL
jgi:hypothetical protein